MTDYENEFHEHKHEGLLIFLCFLGSSLAGYAITHYIGLLGI